MYRFDRKEFFSDMNTEKQIKATALRITVFLILVTAVCLLYLYLAPRTYGSYIAEIYQDGQLIESIPLNQVREPYSFEVEHHDTGTNRVEVRPGSIGVVWADCPDQLCVHQGFAETPVIPITCLPNRLVIRLRPAHENEADPAAPDAVTY